MRFRSAKYISATLIFVIGFVNLTVFGFFTYTNSLKKVESKYFIESSLVVRHMVDSFDTIFRHTENFLLLLSRSIKQSDYLSLQEFFVQFDQYGSIVPKVSRFIYGDTEGWFYMYPGSERPDSYNPREQAWYIATDGLNSGVVWSEPYLDYERQEIVFAVSTPILNSNSQRTGVLAAVFYVSDLAPQVNESVIGTDGFVMILSNNGQVLANRNDYFIGQYVLGDQFAEIPNSPVPVTFDSKIRKKEYMVAAAKLPTNGMSVVAAVAKNEITHALVRSVVVLVGIQLFLTVCFSALMYILVRRGVGPMEKLIGLMKRVELGDYEIQADFDDYSEIASLSQGFNSMLGGIRTRDEILKNREKRIRDLAYYDVLTGLPNRAYLQKHIAKALQDDRDGGAILYVDLDRFKIINDTMGHEVGDQILKAVANSVLNNLRHGQTAARIGGDEFIVHIPDVQSVDLIARITRRILRIIEEPISHDDKSYEISASIGVVLYPLHGNEVHELLRKADLAMYRAKRGGKNGYRIYEENLQEEILKRLNLENGIRDALSNSQFELYYQPQYSFNDGTIVGVEALLRTNSKRLSEYTPQEIVFTAEESGQIVAIERWAMKEACHFAKAINELTDRPITVSINISPVHIMQSDFVGAFLKIIDGVGVSPKAIEIEITETIMMDSDASTTEKLKLLQDQGINAQMDDFGTGYSSLNYLQHLPITVVKIDKSFITSIETDPKQSKISSLIIAIAHSLNLQVIAEGVETDDQYNTLKSYGCDTAQGFLLCKPKPGDEIRKLILKEKSYAAGLRR